MDSISFEILKYVIIVAIILIGRYLIPWMREKLGNEKYERVAYDVKTLVLAAEQMYSDVSGPERRAIVTKKLAEMLQKKNISITDEQIRDLIEAAVKQMKIEEGAGIMIQTTTKDELDE